MSYFVVGALSPEEYKTLGRAYDFLLRVRFELHRLARRRQDHLRFEHQEKISEVLGYVSEGEQDHDRRKHGVERFMRGYYLQARRIRIVSSGIIERATKTPPRTASLRNAPEGFKIFNGDLTIDGNDHFQRDPSALIRIFKVAQEESLNIHPHAKLLTNAHRTLLDKKLRRNSKVVEAFFSLLEDTRADGEMLFQMHDLGYLGSNVSRDGTCDGSMAAFFVSCLYRGCALHSCFPKP